MKGLSAHFPRAYALDVDEPLLGRIRRVMLVLALVNSAAVAPWLVYVGFAARSSWAVVGVVALALVVRNWLAIHRQRRTTMVEDASTAAAIYVVAVVLRDPAHIGLFYTSLFLAAFYGSWRRTMVLIAFYSALYALAIANAPAQQVLSMQTASELVALVFSVAAMHYVASSTVSHERVLMKENVLRDGAVTLLEARTRSDVYASALETTAKMVENAHRVSLKLAMGPCDDQVVVAVEGTRAQRVGDRLSCDTLPPPLRDALREGRSVVVSRMWEAPDEFEEILTRHPLATALMVTPLVSGGAIIGAIWVISHGVIPPAAPESADAWAAEVALALEKVDLAESLRESESRFRHQAMHDPLTDLANRTLFRERVDSALRHGKDGSVAALFLDMDEFKGINDTLGHEAGDELLRIVSERLIKALRPEDTVARLGGDEFAVLLEGISGAKGAARVAERVLALCRRPIALRGHIVSITATVGIAVSSRLQSADELLRNADLAMYAAKQREKGTYELFETGMHTRLVERLGMEHDLRHALERKELLLHFQPTINLSTRQIGGVEALLRWNHPTRGWVPPAEFIPKAEETGLIVPIGRWVLRTACEQLATWCRDNAAAASLDVSINLSARQLRDPHIVADVATALETSGVDATRLILEITESTLMSDMESIGARITQLRNLGVRIAIDDFGMGYSSLSYLRRFPIDIMKIDKSFVDGLERGSETEALFHAILGLADALKIEAVAEGVEQRAQALRLRELGCEVAQGFYFSRPIDAGAVSLLLRAREPRRSRRQATVPVAL